MKQAVAYLMPYMEAEKAGATRRPQGKILMATVKGDVHDIGKNIVGVVLQCNNYEVIDLGVMVPSAEDPRRRAKERTSDIIGLSGLITPSLDEMVHVAGEMQRGGFDMPLLIGGATTSKIHTAVKISPNYPRPRGLRHRRLARGGRLLASCWATATNYAAQIRMDYDEDGRALPARAGRRRSASPSPTRAPTGCRPTGRPTPRRVPAELGLRNIEVPIQTLVSYIDWTPFFSAWEMKGRYPAILNDERFGEPASKLFDDAQKMLAEIVSKKWLTAKGVVGFWPAHADRRRHRRLRRRPRAGPVPHPAPADGENRTGRDTSPCRTSSRRSGGPADYLGGFAVTAGKGEDDVVARFGQKGDDYGKILLQSLADRLAEAFAETRTCGCAAPSGAMRRTRR